MWLVARHFAEGQNFVVHGALINQGDVCFKGLFFAARWLVSINDLKCRKQFPVTIPHNVGAKTAALPNTWMIHRPLSWLFWDNFG